MSGKILLFGFEDLPSILSVGSVAQRFGVDMVPVQRADYSKTLGVLAGVTRAKSTPAPYSGTTLGGRMLVFCDLEAQLDDLLTAIRQAGIGPECLKAVLTAHNQNWTAVQLYGELHSEHQAMNRRR